MSRVGATSAYSQGWLRENAALFFDMNSCGNEKLGDHTMMTYRGSKSYKENMLQVPHQAVMEVMWSITQTELSWN